MLSAAFPFMSNPVHHRAHHRALSYRTPLPTMSMTLRSPWGLFDHLPVGSLWGLFYHLYIRMCRTRPRLSLLC